MRTLGPEPGECKTIAAWCLDPANQLREVPCCPHFQSTSDPVATIRTSNPAGFFSTLPSFDGVGNPIANDGIAIFTIFADHPCNLLKQMLEMMRNTSRALTGSSAGNRNLNVVLEGWPQKLNSRCLHGCLPEPLPSWDSHVL